MIDEDLWTLVRDGTPMSELSNERLFAIMESKHVTTGIFVAAFEEAKRRLCYQKQEPIVAPTA